MTDPAAVPAARPWRCLARQAALPAALWLAFGAAAVSGPDAGIVAAEYREPTTRYPHGALGDETEHGALRLRFSDGRVLDLRLPGDMVFEDTRPRLADLDGDGGAEAIVVESQLDRGSRLAVWTAKGRLAATPFIGRRFRWLAPVGAADLDGDGRVEIAYVETPHLGRVLKLVRLEGDRLVPLAEAAGLTNHRMGAPVIEGRIATCDGRPTILTADAGWRRIIGTVLAEGRLVSRDLARYRGPESFGQVAGCD